MAAINFRYIPPTLRNTGVFTEVSNVNANTIQVNQVTLILGQKLSTGGATAGIPIIYSDPNQAITDFGAGSMLVNMLAQYRITDPFGTLWCLPLADAGGGTQGSITITVGVTGTNTDVTQNGTLSLYVCGIRVTVAVLTTQTNNQIAANIITAFNLLPNLPFTAAVGASTLAHVITLTARHKGVAASDMDVRVNYLGSLNSEATPTGLSIVIGGLSAGTLDPDITTPLSNLSSRQFDFICTPYTGSANLNAMGSFLNDVTGRWSYLSQVYGGAFSAYRGNFAALTSFGVTRNDQHVSIMGFYDSPTPAYMVAADYTAACASSLRVDPALPLGGAGDGVTMNWLAPPIQSQFDFSERNTLLFDGISAYVVEQSGRVRIEYAITSYQVNGAGQPDDSYLDVETMYTLQFMIRDMAIDLGQKFARKKLVDNDTRIQFGSSMVTPNTVLREAIGRYNYYCGLGLAQHATQFGELATAENAGNGTCNLQLPFILANQLRRIEILVEFTKP